MVRLGVEVKMDYTKASDHEINKAVAKKLGVHWIELPDYCNDPAAMWPIIEENKIEIRFNQVEEGLCQAGVLTGNHYSPYHRDKKPLRAAAIVYLMMEN